MGYLYLTRNGSRLRTRVEKRTRLVEKWLLHGAPPGLFERAITEKCALRTQQLRQILLFASWVPPVIRCRCYQRGVNTRVRMMHWPSCLEDKQHSLKWLWNRLEIISTRISLGLDNFANSNNKRDNWVDSSLIQLNLIDLFHLTQLNHISSFISHFCFISNK